MTVIAVGQDARVDAARQLAQLGGCLTELVQRRVQQLDRLSGIGGYLVPGEAQVHTERK